MIDGNIPSKMYRKSAEVCVQVVCCKWDATQIYRWLRPLKNFLLKTKIYPNNNTAYPLILLNLAQKIYILIPIVISRTYQRILRKKNWGQKSADKVWVNYAYSSAKCRLYALLVRIHCKYALLLPLLFSFILRVLPQMSHGSWIRENRNLKERFPRTRICT